MASLTNRELIFKERKLQLIRGLPIHEALNKNINEVLDFVPADGDVIIATYPKTGTTWTQYIVHQILTKGESFPALNDTMKTIVPHLEYSGIQAVEKLTTKPRFYRHHIPYNSMKQNPNTKIIYVYRKPEDTIVSFYHFINSFLGPNFVELDDYVEDFLSGITPYGQYFDHILSYYRHKNEGNILFVSYEKLLANRKEEILRIAQFLGAEYLDLLTQDASLMNKIIERTDFSYMKKNLFLELPRCDIENQNFKKIDFFRKGISGDGKKTLKEDQIRRLTELAKEKMKGTDILTEWLNN